MYTKIESQALARRAEFKLVLLRAEEVVVAGDAGSGVGLEVVEGPGFDGGWGAGDA